MLLHIVARGKIGRSPEADLVDRYLKRISWPTKVTELPERGGKVPDLPPNSINVLLDERGETVSSVDFAKLLENWRSAIVSAALSILLGLSGPARQAAILLAAMPAAVVTTVLALEFDLEASFDTSVVFVSTMLSPFSLVLIIAYLQRL